MNISFFLILAGILILSEAFVLINMSLESLGAYERFFILRKLRPCLVVPMIPFYLIWIGLLKVRDLIYTIAEWVSDNLWSTIIFLILFTLSAGAFIYVRIANGHPIRQSIASNVATDALFALITIFAIGRIENLRRAAENKRANEPIYDDLEIILNKTMLNLLIELGAAERKAAIRRNMMFDGDSKIYDALKSLHEDDDRLASFCRDLTRTKGDIKKMIGVAKVVREGMGQVQHVAAKIKPAPLSGDLYKRYKYYKIDDLRDYRKYLSDGKKYDLHNIVKDGLIVNTRLEIFTNDWDHILGEFYHDLKVDIKELLYLYDLCERREV